MAEHVNTVCADAMVKKRVSETLPSNSNESLLRVTGLPLSATEATVTALFPGRVILLPFFDTYALVPSVSSYIFGCVFCSVVIKRSRLRWFGLWVWSRKNDAEWIQRCTMTDTEGTRQYRHTGKSWWVCVKGLWGVFRLTRWMLVYLQTVASQQSTSLACRVANPVVGHMLSLVPQCIARRHFSCFLISLCPGISRVSLHVVCYESCIRWLIVRYPAAA